MDIYLYLVDKPWGGLPDDSGTKTKAVKKQFYKDAFVWGFVLWLIGYLLGMILFFVVPPDVIGWIIMPIGIIITLWVLLKKIKLQVNCPFSNTSLSITS